MKTGNDGCIISSHDGIRKIPPFEVKTFSTLGCGNVFDAAFVKAFMDDMSIEDAGRFANRAAALNSRAIGVVNGAPYLNDLGL